MNNSTFQTKNNHIALFRTLRIEDLESVTEYINELSEEDTFIIYSGEKLTLEDEKAYVTRLLKDVANHDAVSLGCFIEGKLVSLANIERNTESLKRRRHIGIYSIAVLKKYRGQGIGFAVSTQLIEAAKGHMPDLRLLQLNVYEPNTKAYSLYKKLGFQEYGMLPGGILFHDEYVDDIHMYLSLV